MRTYEQIDADAKAGDSPFSNGSEYDSWSTNWCDRCRHARQAQGCPIIGVSMLTGWPAEWTRETHTWEIGDKSGTYEVVGACTEFDEKRRGGSDGPRKPRPQVDGQLDIVDVYLDTAIDELTKAPSEVAA